MNGTRLALPLCNIYKREIKHEITDDVLEHTTRNSCNFYRLRSFNGYIYIYIPDRLDGTRC